MMYLIVTLTMNPAIDRTIAVDRLAFDDRAYILSSKDSPGGRGINAASVIHSFGGKTLAIFPAGRRSRRSLRTLHARLRISRRHRAHPQRHPAQLHHRRSSRTDREAQRAWSAAGTRRAVERRRDRRSATGKRLVADAVRQSASRRARRFLRAAHRPREKERRPHTCSIPTAKPSRGASKPARRWSRRISRKRNGCSTPCCSRVRIHWRPCADSVDGRRVGRVVARQPRGHRGRPLAGRQINCGKPRRRAWKRFHPSAPAMRWRRRSPGRSGMATISPRR